MMNREGEGMKYVTEKLFELQDLEYQAFHSRLMPTINPDVIIGVRTPVLRRFTRDFEKTGYVKDFLAELPHTYYEENNLHGFLLERIQDFDECVREVDRFLPYVDNWATCDLMRPKVFKKHTEELVPHIRRWIAGDEPFTIRFGIEMLMTFYLDEEFKEEYLELVAAVTHEHYYVKMMVAWYFATALAKQHDDALPYLERGVLEPWTHNKTIQKAIESYRVDAETKAYIRTLKR